MTGRQMVQLEPTGRVGLLEVRCFQNENRPAHSVMNLAMHGHKAGLVEHNGAGPFISAVAPEIEALRSRIGEDVVVSIV